MEHRRGVLSACEGLQKTHSRQAVGVHPQAEAGGGKKKTRKKKKNNRASLENTHCPARTDLEEIRVQGRREGAQALTTLQRGTSTLPARSRTGSSEQLRPAPPLTACDYRTKSPFFYPALAREP